MHVIAVFQVLIYVGAVMVFMVYVIMLLDVRDRVVHAPLLAAARARASPASCCFVGDARHALWRGAAGAPAAATARRSALQQFSIAFLNEYWLHFELVSVLLVAAVVAALAVIKVGRSDHG